MVSREQAIEMAWRLFETAAPVTDVSSVEAWFIDGTWSVLFHKHEHEEYVESPGCWMILVTVSGQASRFDVL